MSSRRLLTGSYGGVWAIATVPMLPARPRDPGCPKGLPATPKMVVVITQWDGNGRVYKYLKREGITILYLAARLTCICEFFSH